MARALPLVADILMSKHYHDGLFAFSVLIEHWRQRGETVALEALGQTWPSQALNDPDFRADIVSACERLKSVPSLTAEERAVIEALQKRVQTP